MSTAWERHGMCELALRDLHMVLVSILELQGNLLARTVRFVWAVYKLHLREYRETV
jgi:hypothetical protein